MVQILRKLHKHGLFSFGKKWESALHKLHTVVNSFTVTCSPHMKWFSGIYFIHVVLIRSLWVLLLVINWKFQKRSCSDVIRSVTRQCRNEIKRDGFSAWYLKSELPNSKYLCRPNDRVWICVILTDSNVISAALSVRKTEIKQVFCTCAAHL